MPTDREATPKKAPADLSLGVKAIVKERDRVASINGALDLLLEELPRDDGRVVNLRVDLEALRTRYAAAHRDLVSAQSVLEDIDLNGEG